MRSAGFCRAVVFGTVLLIGGCGGHDEPEPPSPSAQAAQAYLSQLGAASYDIGVVRELGDYEVARFRDKASGDAYAIYGSKDATGQAVEIQQMVRTDKAGVSTTVDYQANGDRSFTGANGVQLAVTRQQDGKWLAEFRDPASGASFKTNLPDTTASQVASAAATGTVTMQGGGAQVLAVAGPPSTANQIVANVRTSNCGTLADPLGQRVYVQFNSGTGAFLGRYPAARTGTGTYQALIPNPGREAGISIEFLTTALSAADTALGKICELDSASPMALPASCAYISAQMALTGIGAAVAGQFLAVCEAAVVVTKASCAIKNVIDLPVPPGIDDATAGLLPSLEGFLIDKLPQEILSPTLAALITALPTDVYGPQVAIPNWSSAVDLQLDLFRLNVGDIVLTPPSPSARNPYTASAPLQCLAPGSSATLQVQGSDGYVDQQQQAYDAVTNSATITLGVPGADQAGIRDTLTLTVTTPNAPDVVRTAYLVFQ